MNAVVYYSNTGQSRAVAEYLAERLGYPALDMEACGDIPPPIRSGTGQSALMRC